MLKNEGVCEEGLKLVKVQRKLLINYFITLGLLDMVYVVRRRLEFPST